MTMIQVLAHLIEPIIVAARMMGYRVEVKEFWIHVYREELYFYIEYEKDQFEYVLSVIDGELLETSNEFEIRSKFLDLL